MKKNYDSSHEKEWNPNKFYIPDWMGPDSQGGTFIGGLDRTGFKLSLWLVCADDLTVEEERQVARREGRGSAFPKMPDAWFDHLQKFVRNGARCFKMDPENLIQEHPGRKYYNGLSDLENHNLTQVLYHKQMCAGYEEFAKQRAMTHYCAAYAGVQHWGATTMGDNGGGPKALVWMLNYGMSGHMNTSCDMETRGQGLHFGFLQPWSQHNNWAYANQPWFLGKRAEAMFRDYTLYEDDGNSLAYLSGAVAVTRVRCEAGPVAVTLTIEPRQGAYARMPLQRDYEVWIHSRPAKKLAINGTQAAADYDPVAKATRIAVQEDAGRKAAIHLQCEF
jgi:hypothetical protein